MRNNLELLLVFMRKNLELLLVFMGKNLIMLPVMFYPYIYMICVVTFYYINDVASELYEEASLGMFIFAIICNLYVLIVVIVNLIRAIKGKWNAIELVKLNMIIKLVHVPAFVFHFLLGMAGLVASVWGIGFIMWAVLIDLLTIGLTGMIGLSASVSCRKEGMLTNPMAFLYAVLSYIYCVDVISAIAFYVKLRKGNKIA